MSSKPLGLLLVSMSLAACGSSTSSTSSTSSSSHAAAATTHTTATSAAAPSTGPVSVSIKGYAFQPATITVAPGTKVTFTNHDQTAHTATSTAKAFDTGTLNPGASKAVVLHKPGTYTYYCQFHAFMRATVVVK
jgi:plastocyanin